MESQQTDNLMHVPMLRNDSDTDIVALEEQIKDEEPLHLETTVLDN